MKQKPQQAHRINRVKGYAENIAAMMKCAADPDTSAGESQIMLERAQAQMEHALRWLEKAVVGAEREMEKK